MPNIYLPPVIQIPSALTITAITKANPMVITVEVTDDSTGVNSYIVGQAVRLNIPYEYGMFQASNLVGTITAINGSEFTLDLDSSLFDTFAIPSSGETQPATIAPSGSRNYQYNNNSGVVPFQSYNNKGN